MRRAAALVLVCLAGCEPFPERREESPLADFGVVAVLPFVNQTGVPFDADEFANILASELVKGGGVRVLRPSQLRAADPLRSADDAIRLGRKVKADAVLACAITDYDPYDPPRVAISAQFLRVSAGPMSAQDLDRLLQSASWRRGPLTLSRERAAHAVAAFEEVYDAHDPQIRRALQLYARGRDSAFGGDREYLAVQSRYLEFVSARLVQRLSAHGS